MAPPLAWGQADLQRLERSWQSLDQQLRALDALIPPDREPSPDPTSPARPYWLPTPPPRANCNRPRPQPRHP